ncbi:MAG TPA: aspartate aminotransferase family protein [Candidatus Binatia bacterium]|jgi:acetylornithine/succinyldiaminopimelate/putrescine aminotransferase|nr:aspartate aminotransferase family protein [Candidatus Binatia bacterium]
MSALREDFFRFICQTSPEPLGIEVARAHGCVVVDTSGREYLDLLSGIGVASLGHTHPAVVQAIGAQAERYLHTMVYGEYLQEPQVRLARRLAEVTPGELSVTYFTNSGTEAVEGALKTARKYTGRSGFVSFVGGFHGDTFGSLSLGGNPVYRIPFEPLLPQVTFLPFNDFDALGQIDETVAAVLIEPIQGEGGVRIPDPEFLPRLRQRCSEVGALLIFDEVITGLGRTGRLFAGEHWDVTPDILVLAKALGGGMPLGAFVGTLAIMATLSRDPPLAHVTTFGGHPVCCAAGLASLEVILHQELPQHAQVKGDELLRKLQSLCGTGGLSGVRGRGLLIGMDFVTPEATKNFVHNCFAAGLILGWTLHRDTVVRLAPPLIISSAEIDRAVSLMQAVLRQGNRYC